MDNGVEFQNSTHNDWQIFSIIGRIDVATSAKLAVDMSATDYISSAGLRALLRLSKKAARAKKSFAIFGTTGIIQEVFEASGMDMLVTVYKSKNNLP